MSAFKQVEICSSVHETITLWFRRVNSTLTHNIRHFLSNLMALPAQPNTPRKNTVRRLLLELCLSDPSETLIERGVALPW